MTAPVCGQPGNQISVDFLPYGNQISVNQVTKSAWITLTIHPRLGITPGVQISVPELLF